MSARARAITPSAWRRRSGRAAACWPRTSWKKRISDWLQRVQRERLDNVAVRLGKPDDPMLPPRSFDRIFLVHMYHEVQSPYAFLWNMREGLKPDGLVVVVDSDRPTKRHGISPDLLSCEFAAVGLRRVETEELTGGEGYLAKFRLAGPRPQPAAIKPCSMQAS